RAASSIWRWRKLGPAVGCWPRPRTISEIRSLSGIVLFLLGKYLRRYRRAAKWHWINRCTAKWTARQLRKNHLATTRWPIYRLAATQIFMHRSQVFLRNLKRRWRRRPETSTSRRLLLHLHDQLLRLGKRQHK